MTNLKGLKALQEEAVPVGWAEGPEVLRGELRDRDKREGRLDGSVS